MARNKFCTIVLVYLCLVIAATSSFPFPFPLRRPKQCGKQFIGQPRQTKIVGGWTASQGEFPWMVSFKAKHGHFCGGTVISDSIILCAAHCFYRNEYLEYSKTGSVKLHSLNVTLGEYSLKNKHEVSEVSVSLKKIHIHPKYDPVTKQNDIALIEISKRVSSIAPNVMPACLPGNSDTGMWDQGKRAMVIGWGKLDHNQDYYDWLEAVDVLRKVEVNIWEKNACIEKYRDFPNFPSNSFLCAGQEGRESCTGDSGGPMLQLNGDKWVVIGVVANGNKCGAYGRPGIYTLVFDFLPWINSYIK